MRSVKNVQFEVLKDIKPLAVTSAQLAFALATKQVVKFKTQKLSNGTKDVPVVNTPVYPVTKESIDDVVVKRGFHTKQAIYGK